MWFIVAVYKEMKLLNEDAVEMESTETFNDLLFEVLGYDIFDQPIVVQFYNELTKNWTNVKYGLSANLNLCEKFQPCQVKFTLKEQESLEKRNRQNDINGLSKIMETNRIPKLPKERNFVTRHDLLYNDLIKLLKDELLFDVTNYNFFMKHSFDFDNYQNMLKYKLNLSIFFLLKYDIFSNSNTNKLK